MVIGITGKSGSGKTTYTKTLAKENGYFIIHIDEIGHKVLESDYVKNKLIEIFGTTDRKQIGDLIFTHRHLYENLTDLVWSDIKKEINTLLETHDNVILDWLLLPHTHYWAMCDKKILVVADEEDRKTRVMARDNISAEYLNKRDAAGIDYDSIQFDEIIKN